MIKTHLYEAPFAKPYLVKFEKNILSPSMEGGEWDNPFGDSSSSSSSNNAPKKGMWHWMDGE